MLPESISSSGLFFSSNLATDTFLNFVGGVSSSSLDLFVDVDVDVVVYERFKPSVRPGVFILDSGVFIGDLNGFMFVRLRPSERIRGLSLQFNAAKQARKNVINIK